MIIGVGQIYTKLRTPSHPPGKNVLATALDFLCKVRYFSFHFSLVTWVIVMVKLTGGRLLWVRLYV